jgi:hypothetical protein
MFFKGQTDPVDLRGSDTPRAFILARDRLFFKFRVLFGFKPDVKK